jgi:hypothetical protein
MFFLQDSQPNCTLKYLLRLKLLFILFNFNLVYIFISISYLIESTMELNQTPLHKEALTSELSVAEPLIIVLNSWIFNSSFTIYFFSSGEISELNKVSQPVILPAVCPCLLEPPYFFRHY